MSNWSRLVIARLVADYWREAAMDESVAYEPIEMRIAAHPLCMVLAALDGETDPRELGVAAGSVADAIRSVASKA